MCDVFSTNPFEESPDFDDAGSRFSSRPLAIDDIRQQQEQIIRGLLLTNSKMSLKRNLKISELLILRTFVFVTEQDAGLESLGAIISRQKQLALDIGNEVDDQTGNLRYFVQHYCFMV